MTGLLIVLLAFIGVGFVACLVLQIRVWVKKRAEKRRKKGEKIYNEGNLNE